MLSETLKKTRQKAFLTQEAFAQEIGISLSTVNRWETGRTKPRLSALKKLKLFCEKYGLPYEKIEIEWFESSSEVQK